MRKIDRSPAAILVTIGALGLAACSSDGLGSDDVGSETGAVSGAAFTTFVDPDGCVLGSDNGINCNHYRSKPDVYMNGGPVANGLTDGIYYFAVLTPGSQNGGFNDGEEGNLSDNVGFGGNDQGIGDTEADRTFVVVGGEIVTNLGKHAEGTSPNGKMILQLIEFDDTSNNGGVYILAVCEQNATSPKQCKYDAFKVEEERVKPPVCGDGNVDEGEECDDGNTMSGDGCSADCKREKTRCCGDGTVDEGEECDDGNSMSGDGCSAECTREEVKPPCCGDGQQTRGEECDDGNTANYDGCSSRCTIESW